MTPLLVFLVSAAVLPTVWRARYSSPLPEMAGHLRNTLLLLLVSAAVRTVFASDTTSFFAYLKEHAVETQESVEEKSSGDREGRQVPVTNGPGFSFSFSVGGLVAINGVSNFSKA